MSPIEHSRESNTYQTYHIDVLDGIRAIAILIVVWFHFWQQSWLMPIVGNFAVKLKEFRIPYWEGDTPPNQLDDKPWMWKYMLLCILISFVVAILTTYLLEKPISKLILRRYGKSKQ